MVPLLKINNLYKKYKQDSNHQFILKDLNFTVESGAFVIIMGKSGSGKSTLLNMIGLLDDFDEGSYLYKEKDITLLNDNERSEFRNKNIGFIFQQFHLIDSLTVFQNIELALIYHGGFTYNQRVKIVKETLNSLDLDDKFDSYPNQLSGGQQQRVSIARALVVQPSLIIADEPTGALDSMTSLQIVELLVQLNKQGKTIVMVTHDDDLKSYATNYFYLEDGAFIKEKKI